MGEMRERMARAVLTDIQEKIGTIICGIDVGGVALREMQIPSNRAVAHAADKLQMDPTKVAAVWMCIIEGELLDT